MKRIFAIARLTFKAAYRFRLIWVLAALLVVAVVVLPMFLKDVGKAQDITQLLLTYTLTAITGLLGFATLWLACGTMARDMEECQMQMVVVKPIARWQVWAGKWLGIMALNLVLLVFAGLSVYGMLHWRASKLTPEQQQTLRDEVFVARGSAREPVLELESTVDKIYAERIKETTVAAMDREFVRNQIREQLKQEFQLIRPEYARVWKINLGLGKHLAKDKPLFIRTKFTSSQKTESGTYTVLWQVGVPDTPKVWREQRSMAQETFHQFPIPPNLYDEDGNVTVMVLNPNPMELLFQLEDGLEILYPEGSFGLNYVRGLTIIFFWIGLLAAVGLAAASLLSFPVATFFALGMLVIVFSGGTIKQVLTEGTVWEVNHETGVADQPALIDYVALPVFRALANAIGMVEQFSPIEALSTGRSITWAQLSLAFAQIWLLLGGAFALFGIVTFTRREMATAQGTQ